MLCDVIWHLLVSRLTQLWGSQLLACFPVHSYMTRVANQLGPALGTSIILAVFGGFLLVRRFPRRYMHTLYLLDRQRRLSIISILNSRRCRTLHGRYVVHSRDWSCAVLEYKTRLTHLISISHLSWLQPYISLLPWRDVKFKT